VAQVHGADQEGLQDSLQSSNPLATMPAADARMLNETAAITSRTSSSRSFLHSHADPENMNPNLGAARLAGGGRRGRLTVGSGPQAASKLSTGGGLGRGGCALGSAAAPSAARQFGGDLTNLVDTGRVAALKSKLSTVAATAGPRSGREQRMVGSGSMSGGLQGFSGNGSFVAPALGAFSGGAASARSFVPAPVAPLQPVALPPTLQTRAPAENVRREAQQQEEEVGGDPQSVAEYVPQIVATLFAEEAIHMPAANYMELQTDINGKMRAILIDWLCEVHMKYRLRHETLFLAVNLIDRFLATAPVARRRLQLIGVVGMFVASKFEEIDPPRVNDFVYITDNTYTKEDILNTECAMLAALAFNVVVPTAVHFVPHFFQLNRCDGPHGELARYMIELALVDLKMIRHTPSVLVAASLLLSNELLGRAQIWPDAMAQQSRQTEQSLRGCAEELRAVLRAAPASNLQAVRKKYMPQQHHSVARMPMLATA